MSKKLGEYVGYRVRFNDLSSKETKILFLTDGMAVMEAVRDPEFKRYGVIILDEAHERSIHTDVLLGLVVQ